MLIFEENRLKDIKGPASVRLLKLIGPGQLSAFSLLSLQRAQNSYKYRFMRSMASLQI